MAQPHAQDRTSTDTAHEVTMSLLGDTFAVHEVGERLAYTEILPHLVRLGEGAPRKHLTILVSAREITRHFDLAARPADDDSLVALLPALESAVETLREVLSDAEFGWEGCHFRAGLLERESASPASDGELRILISPRGGALTLPGRGPSLPPDMHHAVSKVLAPERCPVPDTEVAPLLSQRSLSGDLLATCGLISFLRRRSDVVRDLSLDTIRQIEFEFPRFVEDGVLSP